MEASTWIATALLTLCMACGPTNNVKRAVIDCTVASRPQIEALLLEFRQILVGEVPNWQAVLDRAIAAGETVGGCALAEIVQNRMRAPEQAPTARSALAPVPTPERDPREVLEQFRAEHARGATFRTAKGDM